MGALGGNESGFGGMTIVNQGLGRYFERAAAGKIFTACNQVGVTSQAGLSGTTPVLTLYNPINSGILVSLLFAAAILTVSAATAGAVWLAQHQGTSAGAVSANGTALVTRRTRVPIAAAISGSALALLAATATTPVAVSMLGVLKTGAITTVPEMVRLGEWYDGAYQLEAGAAFSIQTGVASGASGLFCQYIWEEITL